MSNESEKTANYVMLELMVNAALQGHDLTSWEQIQNGGYEARCRKCQRTVWVGVAGLQYSLLEPVCQQPAL